MPRWIGPVEMALYELDKERCNFLGYPIVKTSSLNRHETRAIAFNQKLSME